MGTGLLTSKGVAPLLDIRVIAGLLTSCESLVRMIVVSDRFLWVISSVGLEHLLDKQGVTGSNPVLPNMI